MWISAKGLNLTPNLTPKRNGIMDDDDVLGFLPKIFF